MLNVIAIMGRIVAEPTLRKTPNNVSTCTITIACERSYVKPGAERQTDFLDVVMWRGTADFVAKWFRKGQMIAIDGSLQTRIYEDKEGKKRKVYEVVADDVSFAGDKRDTSNQDTRTPRDKSGLSAENEGFAVVEENEDLPF